MLILALAGGAVALLVVVAGAAGAVWFVSAKRATPPANVVAQAGQPAPVVQPVNNAQQGLPRTTPPNPAGQQANAGGPAGQPAPQPAPQPNTQPAPQPKTQPGPAKQPATKRPAVALTPTPPEGWGWYVQPSRAYAMWLPKTGRKLYQREETKKLKDFNVRYTVLDCEIKDDVRVNVLVLKLPVQKGEQVDRVTVYEMFRDIFLKDSEGKVTSESDVKVGNVAGKEYRIDVKSGEKARVRLLLLGAAVFQITTIGTQDQVEGQTANNVYESFLHEGMLGAQLRKK
jgi:hypothetical protein